MLLSSSIEKQRANSECPVRTNPRVALCLGHALLPLQKPYRRAQQTALQHPRSKNKRLPCQKFYPGASPAERRGDPQFDPGLLLLFSELLGCSPPGLVAESLLASQSGFL